MSSSLSRDTVHINFWIIDRPFNRHAGIKLLIEAHKDKA
jgi:hypothetical protein